MKNKGLQKLLENISTFSMETAAGGAQQPSGQETVSMATSAWLC